MKDWFRERFHGLYWRQMAVTVGMVFLTLVLLGVSFFSLSYSYARGQKTDELMVRAMAVSKLSVRYLETGRYLSMEELQKDEQFRQLAGVVKYRITLPQSGFSGFHRQQLFFLMYLAGFQVQQCRGRGIVAGINPQNLCHRQCPPLPPASNGHRHPVRR